LDTYGLTVALSVPIFTGHTLTMNKRRAEADLEAARSTLDSLRQQVDLEVFESFQNVQTALQRVRTSRDLVASAAQSHDVALGRYQAGAGGILELMAAQSALEDARAQEVQARTDWFVALARLARDSGSLDLSPPAAAQMPVTEKGRQP
jgi:outer membrane protein TolC